MTDNLPATRPQSSLAERMTYAKALAASDLLPRAYQGKPANILLAIEYGDALGLAPIAAIQGVHVIEGRPSASAQLIGALVRRAGHRLRVQVNAQGTAAKATIIRSDDPEFTFESVWTIERAQSANLVGKGSWKTYPAAMLKARAITEVARDACPEVLSGVAYTAEELGHDEERPATVPVPVEAPMADPWTHEAPVEHVDMETGEIVDAEIVEVEDPPADLYQEEPEPERAPSASTGSARGPLARDIATRPATDKQIGFLASLAKKAGHVDLDAYLDSPAAESVLGGRPSVPVTDGQARLLIDALKAELA